MKKLQHTIKCKLIVTPHATNELKATMREFAKACNLIAETGFNQKLHRRYDLHHATYNQVREQTDLPSQHVINAIAKVAEQFTRERNKQHKFKQLSSVRYDSRTLTFKRDFHEATLTVCPKGRISGEIQTSAAMREKLRTWKIGSADLIFRGGEFYLHISVNTDAPEVSEPTGSLGVDLGVKRLAVTSDNTFHTAKFIRHKKRAFQSTRSSLQANGSRTAKRVLRRVSGRENRFITDANHCISKSIVAHAKANGQRIVLEDLSGIRVRVKRFMTKHLHGWSFAQLRSFIEYKAAAAGVEAATVNPAFTSKGCSRCLHIGSRSSQSNFNCAHCGLRLNADINGARSVAVRYDLMATGGYFCSLEVSQPAQSVLTGETQAVSFR
jgi:IS605 OrfB family transposase